MKVNPSDAEVASDPRSSKRMLRKVIFKNLPDSEGYEESEYESYNEIAVKIIQNPVVTDQILELFFFAGEDWATFPSVKILAARKHSTFPQTFFNLAFSYDYEVRALIACHAETPSFILTKLSTDKFDLVRAYVAANSNLNPIILRYMAIRDEDETVRRIASEQLLKRELS